MEYDRRESEIDYRSRLGEPSDGTQDLFSRMNYEAGVTWSFMTDGWTRRRRANEAVDIGALQGALELEASCVEALQDRSIFLHPNTNQLRYELYAGVLLVPQLLPIAAGERSSLRHAVSEWHRGYEQWRVEPSDDHRALIDDWRRWLRSDGLKRAPVGSELRGEASLLAAASQRISQALNPKTWSPDNVSRAISMQLHPSIFVVPPFDDHEQHYWREERRGHDTEPSATLSPPPPVKT
jgi:hypothetical protein